MLNPFYLVRLTLAYCVHLLHKSTAKEKYIVFNSYKNKSFCFNSKYLFKYMHQQNYRCYFIVNDNEERKELENTFGRAIITTRSINDLILILDAPVWVTSTAPPIRLPGIAKNRYIVNLWHGIPLKLVGVLDKNCPPYRKLLVKWLYAKNTDVFCVTSTELIQPMSESFLLPKEKIFAIGHPQSQIVMTSKAPDNHKNSSRTTFRIIYCPTYRDGETTKLFPFPSFSLELFDAFLEQQNIEIYIKTHHSDISAKELNHSRRILYFNSRDDIIESLGHYDCMITDYSSLFFDYLLLDRPLIFLPYDLGKYQDERGMYFKYERVTPGPKPNSIEAFKVSILEARDQPGKYADARLAIKTQFYTYTGQANENIIGLIEDSAEWKSEK